MTMLAIFHLFLASVLSMILVERPTKMIALSTVWNAIIAAVYISEAMP